MSVDPNEAWESGVIPHGSEVAAHTRHAHGTRTGIALRKRAATISISPNQPGRVEDPKVTSHISHHVLNIILCCYFLSATPDITSHEDGEEVASSCIPGWDRRPDRRGPRVVFGIVVTAAHKHIQLNNLLGQVLSLSETMRETTINTLWVVN